MTLTHVWASWSEFTDETACLVSQLIAIAQDQTKTARAVVQP